MTDTSQWMHLRASQPQLELREVDVHFAQSLCELADEKRPALMALIALLSRDVAYGHVCLPLSLVAHRVNATASEPWLQLRKWSIDELRRVLLSSPLCSAEVSTCPLVLSRGRVYLQRLAEHEAALAELVLARAAASEEVWDGLEEALHRLFTTQKPSAESEGELTDIARHSVSQQRHAAEATTTGLLTVISGGPGTGKTSTVVKILALLQEKARQEGRAALRVALLAPTGKAAARLSQSIASAKTTVPCAPEVRACIADTATTIHCALGVRPGSSNVERNRQFPLDADVVIVDEASMVDLALMRRLFDAVPKAARLILLGDREQLASVEAGAVLGDLCGVGLTLAERQGASIAGRMVVLEHSYRYRADSGIGVLARAIAGGDADAALSVLSDERFDDVCLRMPLVADQMQIPPELVEGYVALLTARDVDAALAQVGRFRILCAHRGGPFGVERLNARVEGVLRERGYINTDAAMYPGRPILVQRNDAVAQVYNGDVGVVFVDNESSSHDLRVMLEGAQGVRRMLSPARLPQFESVYAMTVHKSQGSEFDQVALVLPSEASAVLSRELLYTAVTRARRQVVVYSHESVLRAAISKTIERRSGLRQRLWGA